MNKLQYIDDLGKSLIYDHSDTFDYSGILSLESLHVPTLPSPAINTWQLTLNSRRHIKLDNCMMMLDKNSLYKVHLHECFLAFSKRKKVDLS